MTRPRRPQQPSRATLAAGASRPEPSAEVLRGERRDHSAGGSERCRQGVPQSRAAGRGCPEGCLALSLPFRRVRRGAGRRQGDGIRYGDRAWMLGGLGRPDLAYSVELVLDRHRVHGACLAAEHLRGAQVDHLAFERRGKRAEGGTLALVAVGRARPIRSAARRFRPPGCSCTPRTSRAPQERRRRRVSPVVVRRPKSCTP